MKKIWIAATAAIAIAAVLTYVLNRRTTTVEEEETEPKRAKTPKHRTQVFSKAKELSQQHN